MRNTSAGAAPPQARPARLDPVGRVRLPRRTTTLRAMLVAALLLTATGVLYSGGGDSGGAPDPATAAPSPEPTRTEDLRQPIPDGMVGVPVPLAEPAALAVLHPGDRIDLLSVSAAGGEPAPVATDAAVLALDRAGGSVLLSLTDEQARVVLSAPAEARFAVVVRP